MTASEILEAEARNEHVHSQAYKRALHNTLAEVAALRDGLSYAAVDLYASAFTYKSGEADRASERAEKILADTKSSAQSYREHLIRETLERAAKVARENFIPGHSVAGPYFAAICAERIRNLPLGEKNE